MTFFSMLFILLAAVGTGQDEVTLISRGSLSFAYHHSERTFEISDVFSARVLEKGVVRATVGGKEYSTGDAGVAFRRIPAEEQDMLSFEFGGAFTLNIRLEEEGSVRMSVEGNLEGPAVLEAVVPVGEEARPVFLNAEQGKDKNTLVTVLGPASIPGARSLFYPGGDLAVTADADGDVQFEWKSGWRLRSTAGAGGQLLELVFRQQYYEKALELPFYKPMEKRSYWKTAPVVAMTWYGIEGWKGKPAQTREWLHPQIDWVAKHILPYAGDLIFQLDDNYLYNDDAYMRDLSDAIRRKGLIPGIWFTPFGVAPEKASSEHPDWFLHDEKGGLLKAFGGVNFGDPGSHGTAVLNVTNAGAVENWYGMFWEKVHATWNYDFFKIDGQPNVAAQYRKARDGGGVDGYRKGLEIGRSIVGEDKFINGCWGTPLDAIGLVNGSRIGGDTGNNAHAIDVVLRWNYLNNVCWWCDPDAAANLYKAPVERVRLNAQARVLTGQQFLTDDVWTRVPEENLRVWQRSFPMLDIYPVNLYPIDPWKAYDHFDLRIAKPFGTYDVAGLFNYEDRRVMKALDLNRLPLEAEEVHVYEYWSSTYLGRYGRDRSGRFGRAGSIPRLLEPHEGQIFAIVPASKDRPDLISTSRHATQGGLDLEEVEWQRLDDSWRVRGRSSHLVTGDPYELVFGSGRYALSEASASKASVETIQDNAITRMRFIPGKSGEGSWAAVFVPNDKPTLRLMPGACFLHEGESIRVEIRSCGPSGCRWKARAFPGELRVSPEEGEIGPWPDSRLLTIDADLTGLPPESALTGRIEVVVEGFPGSKQTVPVRTFVPKPDNLALEAEAGASSIWGGGYEANCVNDDDTTTRWNSVKGEVNGAWVKLTWPEPRTFDRVVIDECTDHGNRIQAWRLDVGNGTMKTIAQGKSAGRRLIVDLKEPVTASRLVLVVEKASEVPTIWELEVYRWREDGD